MRKAGSKKISEDSIVVAGIDVGKHWLDVATHGETASARFANDPAGHARLAAWLFERRVVRIGLEASGGYERAIVRHLHEAELEVAVLQPRQVRAFAVFRLRRAKSDPLDAVLIAACTAALGETRAVPDARFDGLAERLTFIEQVEQDMARAKTRAEAFRLPALRQAVADEIRRLRRCRLTLLKQLVGLVRGEPDLAARLALLQSIPGIGERTALALLIRMPELGSISREQAAALAGVAPFDDQSGQRSGQRHIAGGRDRVRKSLYAAALPAAFRWNKALIALYQRLKAKGKPHKVILIACAHKLLTFANAVLQRGTPWRQIEALT